MKKTEYFQLLRDPRWQKKRLEIMSRDNFECLDCGESEKTLNVHHVHYVKGRAPWQYHDSTLVTLCENCHEEDHRYGYELEKHLPSSLKQIGVRPNQIAGFAYTIDLLREKYGEEKAKVLVEHLNMLASNIWIDESVIGRFFDLIEQTNQKINAEADHA